MSSNLPRINPENMSNPPTRDRATWRKFYAHSHEWVNQQFSQQWEAQLGAPDDQLLKVEEEDWCW